MIMKNIIGISDSMDSPLGKSDGLISIILFLDMLYLPLITAMKN